MHREIEVNDEILLQRDDSYLLRSVKDKEIESIAPKIKEIGIALVENLEIDGFNPLFRDHKKEASKLALSKVNTELDEEKA